MEQCVAKPAILSLKFATLAQNEKPLSFNAFSDLALRDFTKESSQHGKTTENNKLELFAITLSS